MRSWIFVLTLITATSVPAQWRDNGKFVPDTEWRKSSGKFGASLEFTATPNELFEVWNKPGLYVNIPKSVETTHRGEVIMGVVFFAGCKADEKGNCDATVDYLVLRPDRSVYGDHKNGDLWKSKPAPGASAIELCAQPLGIKIEETDPIGEYKVYATVRDLNAGLTLHLSRSFRVLAVPRN